MAGALEYRIKTINVVIGGSLEALRYAGSLEPEETLLINVFAKTPGVGQHDESGFSLFQEWIELNTALVFSGSSPFSELGRQVIVESYENGLYLIKVFSQMGKLAEILAERLIIFDPENVEMRIPEEVESFEGENSRYVVRDTFKVFELHCINPMSVKLITFDSERFQNIYFHYDSEFNRSSYVPPYVTTSKYWQRRIAETISFSLSESDFKKYELNVSRLLLEVSLKELAFTASSYEPISRHVSIVRTFKSSKCGIEYAPKEQGTINPKISEFKTTCLKPFQRWTV